KYRKYILAFICFIGFSFGAIYIGNGMIVMFPFIEIAFDGSRILCSVLVTVLVCWIYGVQKMCDDIQYACGSPPAKCWKLLWYTLPTLLIVSRLENDDVSCCQYKGGMRSTRV
ncbi:neurotransmitter transporter, partial [Oryctes borbonicus]